jgi:predicted DNA-binding transcriptional regulator AlpA
MQDTNEDVFLTSGKLSQMLGVSQMSLYRWEKQHQLPPAVRINKRKYWRKKDVMAWWDKQSA